MTDALGHRGVWKAPWRGPNGELVLFAMDSKKRLADGPLTVSHQADHVKAADGMWELLDRVDPQPGDSFMGSPPKMYRLPRSARFRFKPDRSNLKLVT